MSKTQNPYAAPASADFAQLSSQDRKLLEAYLHFRHNPPTLTWFAARATPAWVVIVFVFIALVVLNFLLIGRGVALIVGAFALGNAIGIVARDIGYARKTIQRWPLITSVLDFEKVKQLLGVQE